MKTEWEYHVEILVKGSAEEIDDHQKWVEEIAALAERAVVVKKGASNDGAMRIARLSTHFLADGPVDAMLMGLGLLSPRKELSLEITDVNVHLHR